MLDHSIWTLFQIEVQINSSINHTIPNNIGWLSPWPTWPWYRQAAFCIPNAGEYGPLVVEEELSYTLESAQIPSRQKGSWLNKSIETELSNRFGNL